MTSRFQRVSRTASTAGAALLAVISLGACETSGLRLTGEVSPMRSSVTEKYPVQVASAKDSLTIVVKPHVFALGQDDRGRVAQLAESYKHVGHGDIWVVAPTGSSNSAASIGAAAEIAKIMVEQGVKPRAIRMNSYQASAADDAAPITVQYKRYHAYTQSCGDWSDNLAYAPLNGTSKNFGCSAHSNLAALVEDPYDFVEPQDIDPADPSRRATVLSKYRAGVPTGTARSEDERGVVSDIAN